jgi:hypothetical protein
MTQWAVEKNLSWQISGWAGAMSSKRRGEEGCLGSLPGGWVSTGKGPRLGGAGEGGCPWEKDPVLAGAGVGGWNEDAKETEEKLPRRP